MYGDLEGTKIYEIYDKCNFILEKRGIKIDDLYRYVVYDRAPAGVTKVDFEKILNKSLGEDNVIELSQNIDSFDSLRESIAKNVKLTYEEKKEYLWLHSEKLKKKFKVQADYDKLVESILKEKGGQIELNELI